jgi:hypothetical protein
LHWFLCPQKAHNRLLLFGIKILRRGHYLATEPASEHACVSST